MAYQTKQQQAVLRCLQERAEECLSAADLSEDLRQSGLTVGLATVYRQLDKLGGVDPAYGYTLLYSDDKQLTAPVHHYLHQNLHLTGGRVGQIGPTIGTHVGPGVVGVAFVIPE